MNFINIKNVTNVKITDFTICDACGFELWEPLLLLEYSVLGLYDDARFPGRCILKYHHHVEHLADLSAYELQHFTEDMRIAGKLLTKAFNPRRINYAILGNAESHLHAHLIPRYGTDPVPQQSPWNHPEKVSKLSAEKKENIFKEILAALDSQEMSMYDIRADSNLMQYL